MPNRVVVVPCRCCGFYLLGRLCINVDWFSSVGLFISCRLAIIGFWTQAWCSFFWWLEALVKEVTWNGRQCLCSYCSRCLLSVVVYSFVSSFSTLGMSMCFNHYQIVDYFVRNIILTTVISKHVWLIIYSEYSQWKRNVDWEQHGLDFTAAQGVFNRWYWINCSSTWM